MGLAQDVESDAPVIAPLAQIAPSRRAPNRALRGYLAVTGFATAAIVLAAASVGVIRMTTPVSRASTSFGWMATIEAPQVVAVPSAIPEPAPSAAPMPSGSARPVPRGFVRPPSAAPPTPSSATDNPALPSDWKQDMR